MADAGDLKSSDFGLAGSSPAAPTKPLLQHSGPFMDARLAYALAASIMSSAICITRSPRTMPYHCMGMTS